jgi:membrane carboxypeptidase/penicillin-binding protein
MRRIFRRTALLLAIAILGLTAYETWRVFDARAETRALIEARLAVARDQNITLSPDRLAILLKVEDPTFYDNAGFDFETPGAGWTTLTQGLAKRLYFDRFAPGFEKLELILIARFALTPLATKDEILTAVLATAYFGQHEGRPVIGFAEGARAWFGKALADLSDDEYIALVAMLVGPNGLDPVRHGPELAERVARIKRLLAGACAPAGWSDVTLQGCAGLSVDSQTSQEAK